MPLTASMNLSSPSTYRFAPHTLFVNAFDAGLSGDSFHTAKLEWKFGFTAANGSTFADIVTHPDNDKAKLQFVDWRKDFDYGSEALNKAWLAKSGSLTTQYGANAAFTFTKPGTYSVTLNITTESGFTGTTSSTVTITPAGSTYGWVTETVAFDGTAGAAFTYANLATALEAINSRGTPLNRLYLYAGKQYTIPYSLSIGQNCTYIGVTSGSYTTNGFLNRAIIVPSDNFDFTSNTEMISVDASEVSLDSLYFKNTFPTPDTTTLNAISFNSGEQLSIYNCGFKNFNKGIDTTSLFTSKLFVNQCFFNRHRDKAINLGGEEAVLVSNAFFNTNTSTGNQKASYTTYIVGEEGLFYRGLNCSYNYFGYNGVSGKTEWSTYTYPSYPPTFSENSSYGGIGLTNTVNFDHVHIFANYLDKGTNTISGKNVCVRSNYFTSAGNRSMLDILGISGCDIQQNVFRHVSGAPLAGAIFGYGTGTVTNVNFQWNTLLLEEQIQMTSAFVNFKANGRTISNRTLTIDNNLFVDNGYYVGKYVALSSTGHLKSNLTNNVFPVRRPKLAVLGLSGNDISQETIGNYPEFAGNMTADLSPDDFSLLFGFVPDIEICPGLTTSAKCKAFNFDFLGNARFGTGASGSNVIGAVQPQSAIPFPVDSGATFASRFVSTSRNNNSSSSGYAILSEGLTSIVNPSTIVGNYTILEDQSATAADSNGNPATVNPCGSGLGTTFSYIGVTNGFDLTLTYSANPNTNAFERTLGNFNFYGIKLGGFVRILDTNKCARFVEVDNRLLGELNETGTASPSVPFSEVKYSQTSLSYPLNKYSPVCVLQNGRYTLGISLVHDYKTNNRLWIENTRTILNSFGGGLGSWVVSGSWYQNGPNLSNIVATGGTFATQASFRVLRGKQNWWQVVEPWKTYFQTNYGTTRYGRDDRPIRGIQPSQLAFMSTPSEASAFSPFGFYNSNGTDYDGTTVSVRRTDQYGWVKFCGDISRSHESYKYDRIIFWTPGGQFNATGTGGYPARDSNYPFFIFSSFFTAGDPHRSDVLPIQNLYYDQQGRYIKYPNELPTGGTKPMVDTLPLLRNTCLTIPQMSFYWGRSTQVDKTPWFSGTTFDNLDDDNPTLLQKAYDEIDLASCYIQGRGLVLEIFGLPGPQYPDIFTPYLKFDKSIRYLQKYQDRYPGVVYTTEGHHSDFVHLYTTSYRFLKNASSETYLNENPLSWYIVPDNETWAQISHNYIYQRIGTNDLTKEQFLHLGQSVAKQGFNPVILDNLSIAGYESLMNASNSTRRKVYPNTIDWPSLADPTIVTGGYTSQIMNTGFTAYVGNLIQQKASIAWTPNTEPDFDKYGVYRSSNGKTGNFKLLGFTKNSVYLDSVVATGATYYYKVEAFDLFGNRSGYLQQPYALFTGVRVESGNNGGFGDVDAGSTNDSQVGNTGGFGPTSNSGGTGGTSDFGPPGTGNGETGTSSGSRNPENLLWTTNSGVNYTLDGVVYTEQEYRRKQRVGNLRNPLN